MKNTCYIPAFLLLLSLMFTGCRSSQPGDLQEDVRDQLDSATMACFLPAKVQVLPLTKLVSPTNSDSSFHIHAYVSLLDVFDSQIKTPGTFRFELYEKVLRSAEPKGKRIKIWRPDVDLPGEGSRIPRGSLRVRLQQGHRTAGWLRLRRVYPDRRPQAERCKDDGDLGNPPSRACRP